MPRYLFTVLALFVFLFAYTYEEYRVFAQNVSPETSLAAYRDRHTIKEGATLDGSIRISEAVNPPHVSHYIQFANHERTLRAFLAGDKGGVGLIYIEQAQPHKFFAIVGAFSVVPETVSLFWSGPTKLIFYGTAHDGTFMRYELDLHSGTTGSMPASLSPQTETTKVGVLTSD